MGTTNRLKFFIFQIGVVCMLICITISGNAIGNTLCSKVFSQNENKNTIWNAFNVESKGLFHKVKKLFSPSLRHSKSIEISEKIHSELTALQKLIYIDQQRRSVYYDQNGPHPVPEFFDCDLFTYKTLAVLGGGSEGTAFLVENEVGKQFVLKKFLNKSKMVDNLKIAKGLQDKGAKIILPISIDWATYTAIYQFIDGVEVADILRESNHWTLNNLEYPISAETQKFFEDRYGEFIQDHGFYTRLVPVGIIDTNVIFDLSTNQFVIVDPK